MTEFDAANQVFTNTLSTEGGVEALTAVGDRLYTSVIKGFIAFSKDNINISYIGNWSDQFPIGKHSKLQRFESDFPGQRI